jgi:C-terminal processing protease CtpA/Prc
MNKIQLTLCTTLLAFLIPQTHAGSLSESEKRGTIKTINGLLADNYVFPDTATKMSAHLQSQVEQGHYEKLNDGKDFAKQLTADLQSISHDKHLRVLLDREGRRSAKKGDQKSQKEFENKQLRRAQARNFGFEEVKILEGNVGYLRLTQFFDASVGGETAVAAMNFFANAEALIIDLRKNGGGSPSMIQLLTSYLYDSEPVHLNNFYWRPSDLHTQTWTLPHVPGVRRPDMPVYVLTSNRTFSAAEEFSYNLRNLERATLVGETTGGGAHPGGPQRINDDFVLWIPQGRAINPITKTNWEVVGVKPHIETKAADALKVAHEAALKVLADKKS